MTELSGPRTYQNCQGTYTLPFLIFPRVCSVTPGSAIGGEDPRFSFKAFDCHNIPPRIGTFDLVIANHVLFYCDDIGKVCKNVTKILKPGGRFLCSTYGSRHMREVSLLVQSFDERIALSADKLYERFGGKMERISFPLIFSRLPGNPMRTN